MQEPRGRGRGNLRWSRVRNAVADRDRDAVMLHVLPSQPACAWLPRPPRLCQPDTWPLRPGRHVACLTPANAQQAIASHGCIADIPGFADLKPAKLQNEVRHRRERIARVASPMRINWSRRAGSRMVWVQRRAVPRCAAQVRRRLQGLLTSQGGGQSAAAAVEGHAVQPEAEAEADGSSAEEGDSEEEGSPPPRPAAALQHSTRKRRASATATPAGRQRSAVAAVSARKAGGAGGGKRARAKSM